MWAVVSARMPEKCLQEGWKIAMDDDAKKSREPPSGAGFKRISSSPYVHFLFPQNEGLELLYGRADAAYVDATWGWIKRSPRKTEEGWRYCFPRSGLNLMEPYTKPEAVDLKQTLCSLPRGFISLDEEDSRSGGWGKWLYLCSVSRSERCSRAQARQKVISFC